MRRYNDYKKPGNKTPYLTDEEMKTIEWTKYKIIVPTEEDREEILGAFEYFHDEGFDSEIIAVNQLAHEYLIAEREPGSETNIIVDKELYEKLNNGKET